MVYGMDYGLWTMDYGQQYGGRCCTGNRCSDTQTVTKSTDTWCWQVITTHF